MSFTALIEDLEALQKAKPHPEPDGDEGDEKIRAAAGEEAAAKAEASTDDKAAPPAKSAKDEDPDGDEDDGGDDPDNYDDDDEDDEDDGKPFGKSFGVTLDDGTEVEAYDATEILKSFDARIGSQVTELDLLKAEVAALKARDIPSADAIKADLEKVLAAQNTMLKSLQEQITALGAEGRGRKSVLNVHEKPAAAGTEARPETPSDEALMTKALIAQKQGRITGQDVARLDAYLGRGLQAPPEILARLT